MDLEVGDVVEIKSGGPKMTVSEVFSDDNIVMCIWYTDNEEHQTREFDPAVLKKV